LGSIFCLIFYSIFGSILVSTLGSILGSIFASILGSIRKTKQDETSPSSAWVVVMRFMQQNCKRNFLFKDF